MPTPYTPDELAGIGRDRSRSSHACAAIVMDLDYALALGQPDWTQQAMRVLRTATTAKQDVGALLTGRDLVMLQRPCDLAHLMREVEAALRLRYARIPCNLDITVEPAAVTGDVDRLFCVFYGLLENAHAAATRRDDTADDADVQVTLAHQGQRIVITIADNGPGVSPADLPRLGEPGLHLGDLEPIGAGLSLFYARAIVANHGGTLSFQPAEPHGLQVVVELPITEGA